MRHRSHEVSHQSRHRNHKGWLPPESLPLVLWPDNSPDFSQWLWDVLSSPLVPVIILLVVVAIVMLLLAVWLRARRQRPPYEAPTVSPPAAAETEIIDKLQPSEPTAAAAEAPTVYAEDMAKTQPSPVVRPDQSEPPVTLEHEPRVVPVSGERPADISWQIAGLTDVGLKRELNEDTLLMAESMMAGNTPVGLYVVADGLGGHQGGEIASQLTIEAIQTLFDQNPPGPAAAPFNEWLKTAAMAANHAVLARQEDQTQAKKMGSTLVMALVIGREAHIANVGDSRAYRLDQESIEQISEDHSLVERLVQIGQLTREEARSHKNRNVLYNSLGDKAEIDVSLYHIQFRPGDRLLLCSDGLSGMITDEAILDISRGQANPADACTEMVRAAKIAGGNDNITAVIVQQDS